MAEDTVSRSAKNGVNYSSQDLNYFSTDRLFSGI